MLASQSRRGRAEPGRQFRLLRDTRVSLRGADAGKRHVESKDRKIEKSGRKARLESRAQRGPRPGAGGILPDGARGPAVRTARDGDAGIGAAQPIQPRKICNLSRSCGALPRRRRLLSPPARQRADDFSYCNPSAVLVEGGRARTLAKARTENALSIETRVRGAYGPATNFPRRRTSGGIHA